MPLLVEGVMELVTLQEAILALADTMRDLTDGVTTTSVNTRTQLQDTAKANSKDKLWQGSELLLLEPDATNAGFTGRNPREVVGFDSATGLFTLNGDFNSGNGVPANVRYALLRNRGQGTPYRTYLRALRYALDKMDTSTDAIDSSLTTAANTWDYTVPAGLSTVYDVVFENADLGRYSLRPDWWDVAPGRVITLLNRNLTVETPWTLHLYGTISATLPTTLTGTMRVSFEELLNQAEEFLRRTSPRQQENGRAGNLTQERVRFSSTRVHPNEKELY